MGRGVWLRGGAWCQLESWVLGETMEDIFAKKLNGERGVAKRRSLVSVRVWGVGRDNGKYVHKEVELGEGCS